MSVFRLYCRFLYISSIPDICREELAMKVGLTEAMTFIEDNHHPRKAIKHSWLIRGKVH